MSEPVIPEIKDNRKAVMNLESGKCDKIAKRICEEIQESEREKSRLRDRWIRNRELYEVQESTSQVTLIEGQKGYMLPLQRTHLNRIVSAIVNGITGLDPYVQIQDAGNLNDDLEAIAEDLMVLAKDAGDYNALKLGSIDACLTNCGVWRVRPLIDERAYDAPENSDGQPVTKIDWESIDPIDFCCYPPYFGTFAAAKTIGHRWSEMVYRLKSDMAKGQYAYYDLKGGDDPMKYHRTHDDKEEGYSAQSMADEFVELWEVIAELDLEENGKYKRYLCVVALTDTKLLSIQPYPYSIPWYVAVRTEPVRKRIFPNSSLAQILQGLQLAYSDIFTAGLQATFASIGPIMILTGGGLMAKVTQGKPFMVIESAHDVKVQTIQPTPQVGGLNTAKETIEEVTDAVTGINRNATGQQMPASTTATEVDALQQELNQAKDDYTQAIAEGVQWVFRLFLEFYQTHFDELKKAYGERLTADPQVVQTIKPGIEVNGHSGVNSSIMVIQKLQMLMNLVMPLGPNSPYDIEKMIDQIAQLLDLPFDLQRIKKDPNPLDALLKLPQVQQLLMSGEPLPQILQEIQARAQVSGTQPGTQSVPQDPNVAGNPQPVGGGPDGIPPPVLNSGIGTGGPPIPGQMPSLGATP